MEVSGRKNSTGSLKDQFCNICSKNDQHIEARRYCNTCHSHLCDKCFEGHIKDKRLSHHVLDRCFSHNENDPLPACEIHGEKVIEFYCRAHGVLGCIVCMMSHTDCEKDHVQTVSGQFLKSDEYLNVVGCLQDLKGRCSDNMTKIEHNIKEMEIAYTAVINQVRALKTDVIVRLVDLEQKLHEEVDEYRKLNEENMTRLKAELDELIEDMHHTDTLLSNLEEEEKFNSLYIEMKRGEKIILEYHARIYDISTRNCFNDMKLYQTQALDNIMTRENLFGIIEMFDKEEGPCSSDEKLETDHVGRINIKSNDDKKTCYATGLAFLSPDHIAVADKANKNVKIIDVGFDKLISDITLSSSPRDLTLIPPDQLAVTLGDEEKIQLLSTTKGLTTTRQIRTNGYCRGIKHSQEKLIVAFYNTLSPKIEILSLSGETLCKFQFNNAGANLFKEPKRIGLSPNRCYKYVTDVGKMSISRCSLTGHIKNTSEGHRYMGVAVSPGGSVYTCSKSGDTVYKLSDGLSTVEPVLTTIDGIKEPIALAISSSIGKLFVSCGCQDARIANKLHVFKIEQGNSAEINLKRNYPRSVIYDRKSSSDNVRTKIVQQ